MIQKMITLFCLACLSLLSAQNHLATGNARMLGMGGTAGSIANGTHAARFNPACMTYFDRSDGRFTAFVTYKNMYLIQGLQDFTGGFMATKMLDQMELAAAYEIDFFMARRNYKYMNNNLAFSIHKASIAWGLNFSLDMDFMKSETWDEVAEYQDKFFYFNTGWLMIRKDFNLGISLNQLSLPALRKLFLSDKKEEEMMASGKVTAGELVDFRPMSLLLGFSYYFRDDRFIYALDAEFTQPYTDGQDIILRTGGEYILKNGISLRAGLESVNFSGSIALSLGVGFSVRDILIDYGIQTPLRMTGGLGIHVIDVMYNF